MSASYLNANCIKLVIDYLTPFPKLPFEDELLENTSMLNGNFNSFQYWHSGWKHFAFKTYFYYDRDKFSIRKIDDEWHIAYR